MSRPGRLLTSLITVACMALPLWLHAAEPGVDPTAESGVDSTAGPAVDPGHAAAAEELLGLIGIDTGIRPMARRMRETTVEQLAAMDVAQGEEEIARPYLERIGSVIEQTLSWNNLRGDFVDAYTATFTEAELRELSGFFRSDTGSKYLDNVSDLNRLAADIVRENAMAAAPRIREITEEMRAALPADGS